MRQGQGIELYYNKQLRYKGTFKNDQYDGKDCTIHNINGLPEFQGEIKEGQYARGKQFFNNGKLYYEGTFKENMPNGESCQTLYQNGNVHFKVIFYIKIILKYIGKSENGYVQL